MVIIDKQGSENVGLLLPILENYLDKKVWLLFFVLSSKFVLLLLSMICLADIFCCSGVHFS